MFSSVMSFSNPIPLLTRVDWFFAPIFFEISLQEEEGDLGLPIAPETLSWIAIEKGVDNVINNNGGRTVDVNTLILDHASADYVYRTVVDRRIPVALGHLNSINEVDTAAVGQGDIAKQDVFVNVQEEQSSDGETDQIAEEIGIIILE